MASLRLIASAARRAPSTIAVARRGYAEASDKIKLSMALPHQVRRPNSRLSCHAHPLLVHLQFHRRCSSKHLCCNWWHGYSSQPRSFHRTSASWCRGGRRNQRFQKMVWCVSTFLFHATRLNLFR